MTNFLPFSMELEYLTTFEALLVPPYKNKACGNF